jgi:CheY-like chemotaxis protein
VLRDVGAAPLQALQARQRSWNINVLLVDDDPADTVVILNVLHRHPDVATAQAVPAPDLALKQLAAGRLSPDLVLLDIHMPRLDGFEFLECMRRIPAMALAPVVFLTTSSSSDVNQASRGTASSYLVKPDTYADLKSRLDQEIRRVISGEWRD